MDNENLKQLIRVTKDYYLLHLTMDDIAKREGISKASISRIINKAKSLGYVKVSLDLPSLRVTDLEDEFIDMFGLKHVSIVESLSTDKVITTSQISDSLSHYLDKIILDNSVVGVSWGNTMNTIAKQLNPLSKKNNVKVVQLNGSISRRNVSSLSDEIMNTFCKKYDGIGYGLSTPSIVDNQNIASILMEDSTVKETLNIAKAADIAIFSVGSISHDSILIKAGYVSNEDYYDLKATGYVGDICSRYFKADGSHENGELYNRVIGLSLEEIKKIKHSIAIVVGVEKANGLLAALKGNYLNTLFTDEKTAIEVLNIVKKKETEEV